jgi:hypothetical protein
MAARNDVQLSCIYTIKLVIALGYNICTANDGGQLLSLVQRSGRRFGWTKKACRRQAFQSNLTSYFTVCTPLPEDLDLSSATGDEPNHQELL